MAEYQFASLLAADEEQRREGKELLRRIDHQLKKGGFDHPPMFPLEILPEYGLSDEQMRVRTDNLVNERKVMQDALARGDVSAVEGEVEILLDDFGINLDRKGAGYRQLGMAVLRKYVSALEVIARRDSGEPVETPRLIKGADATLADNSGLRIALDGWKKVKVRPANTLREFEHALEWFLQLHGELPVTEIRRRHAREFREALQEVPVRRSGKLRKAPLPDIVQWTKQHPTAQRISVATVNKLLGAVQALAVWSRNNGLIPDELPWADPFADMRLEETRPEREAWQLEELQILFSSPVFTEGLRPEGGRGEAAFWLPLLALYTGARLNELAPLTVADVSTDEASRTVMITIKEVREEGRRLKNVGSRRVVPVHTDLLRIGFMEMLEHVRKREGAKGRLFPLLTPGPKGGFGEAWSKWFGRYKRGLGITNKASVFHSFRHSFKDALRSAGVAEDLNDALCGHVGHGGVARSYGAKDMVRRFGLIRLAEAISTLAYPGLDISDLRWRPPKDPTC
jgi:integrase